MLSARGSGLELHARRRKNVWEIQSSPFSPHSSTDHTSFGILPQEPGSGCGQPLPRSVFACEALCCRETPQAHSRPRSTTLTDSSVIVRWAFLSITALCGVEYAASFFFVLHLFQLQFFFCFFRTIAFFHWKRRGAFRLLVAHVGRVSDRPFLKRWSEGVNSRGSILS